MVSEERARKHAPSGLDSAGGVIGARRVARERQGPGGGVLDARYGPMHLIRVGEDVGIDFPARRIPVAFQPSILLFSTTSTGD